MSPARERAIMGGSREGEYPPLKADDEVAVEQQRQFAWWYHANEKGIAGAL